jgi:AraC family transcriptional regulator
VPAVTVEVDRAERLDARPVRLFANVVELLEVAHEAFERDREAAKASISQAACILRSELQRQEAVTKFDGGAGKLAGWQVLRLRAYVEAHLGEPIQVKDLSDVARRSTAHFCRAFKRTFGQTPHAYVTGCRLQRAKSLMLDSEEPLSVIALICGFTDQAHLSKLFRQHTGETPGAWRRRRAFVEDGASAPWPMHA